MGTRLCPVFDDKFNFFLIFLYFCSNHEVFQVGISHPNIPVKTLKPLIHCDTGVRVAYALFQPEVVRKRLYLSFVLVWSFTFYCRDISRLNICRLDLLDEEEKGEIGGTCSVK